MAKNYRREKIVKAIKKIKLDHEARMNLFFEINRTQTVESLINFQTKVFKTIVEDLCREFDIKEEEIT